MEKALAIQKEVQRILQTEEAYLPVIGFEGAYEVSNIGNVRSVDRIVVHKRNRFDKSFPVFYAGRQLTKKINKYGYVVVCLMKNGDRKDALIHRLVASAFIDNPQYLPQVNHIDADKQNNTVDNLEWVTAQQNVDHAMSHNLQNFAWGDQLPQATLTKDQVVEIKKLLKEGKLNQREIARLFGVGKNAIWFIAKGLTWKKV
jgi:hypothetical protein